MCSCTRKVEIGDILAPVVWPEPSRLRQDRFHGEGTAQVAAEGVAKMAGVDHALGDDVLREARHVPLLQIRDDRIPVWSRGSGPVRVPAEMRHGRQDVEAVAPGRREGWVRRGGTVQVEREIARQGLPGEDVVQQCLVPRPHQDLVVRHVVITTVGSEIDDEQGHRVAQAFESAIRVLASHRPRDEVHVRVRDVPVAHHGIGSQHLSPGQPHAGRAPRARVDDDLLHPGRQMQCSAELLEQADQGSHDRTRATHGEPDAPLLLERVDECVDRRTLERIASHQQGMEAEDLPEPRVANVRVDERCHRAIRAEADKLRHHPQHVHRLDERRVDQRHARLEDRLGRVSEPQVSGDVTGSNALDLRDHLCAVTRVAEHRAVLEPNVVERIDGHERDVVLRSPSAALEQFAQEPRCRDDRRATIEGEAILLIHVRPPAGLVPLFHHDHVVALLEEPDRRRKAAEAAADGDDAHSLCPDDAIQPEQGTIVRLSKQHATRARASRIVQARAIAEARERGPPGLQGPTAAPWPRSRGSRHPTCVARHRQGWETAHSRHRG